MEIESDLQSSYESLLSSSKEDHKSPESSDCEGYATPLATSRSDLVSTIPPKSSETFLDSGELTPTGSSRAVSPIIISSIQLAEKPKILTMTAICGLDSNLSSEDTVTNYNESKETAFESEVKTEKNIEGKETAIEEISVNSGSSEESVNSKDEQSSEFEINILDSVEDAEIRENDQVEEQSYAILVDQEFMDTDEDTDNITEPLENLEFETENKLEEINDTETKIDEEHEEGENSEQSPDGFQCRMRGSKNFGIEEEPETESDSNLLETTEINNIVHIEVAGEQDQDIPAEVQSEKVFEESDEELKCEFNDELSLYKHSEPEKLTPEQHSECELSDDVECSNDVENIELKASESDVIFSNRPEEPEEENEISEKQLIEIDLTRELKLVSEIKHDEDQFDSTFLESSESKSTDSFEWKTDVIEKLQEVDFIHNSTVGSQCQTKDQTDKTNTSLSSEISTSSSEEDDMEITMDFTSEPETENFPQNTSNPESQIPTRTMMLEKYPLPEAEDPESIPSSRENNIFQCDQQMSAEFEELVAAINAFGQQRVVEEPRRETIGSLNGVGRIVESFERNRVSVGVDKRRMEEGDGGNGRREKCVDSVSKCYNDQISQTEHDSLILVDYNLPEVMEAVKEENMRLQLQLDHVKNEEVEILQNTIADLQKQLNEANQTIDGIEVEAEQQYTEMTSEIDELCELVMKKDEEISTLKEKIANLSITQNHFKEDVDSQKIISQRQKEVIEELREEIDSMAKKLDEMTKLRDKAVEEATLNKMRNQEKERFLAKEAQMSLEIEDLQRELNKQKLILNQTSMAKLADTFERKVLKLENDIRERDMLICRQNQIINGSRKTTLSDGKKLISSRTAALAADNLPSAGSSSESFQNGLDQDAKYTILSFLLSDRHSQLANIYNIGRILELNNQEERTLERHLTRDRFT